jgi:ribosomal 50S subunit-associated protein YjgA (DUF615 family)
MSNPMARRPKKISPELEQAQRELEEKGARLAALDNERIAAIDLTADLVAYVTRAKGYMTAEDQMMLRRARVWLIEWGR